MRDEGQMFTGLIEATGAIHSVSAGGGDKQIVIDVGRVCAGARH